MVGCWTGVRSRRETLASVGSRNWIERGVTNGQQCVKVRGRAPGESDRMEESPGKDKAHRVETLVGARDQVRSEDQECAWRAQLGRSFKKQIACERNTSKLLEDLCS